MLYRNYIKPLIDFCLALSAFILAFPIFLFLTIFLYFANQGKPFFFQPRPGKGGRVFRVIKFKTMNDLKDENGELLPNEMRMTPIGNFIRKTSLDEIPQLLNVIKGDMSLVGPRPLLVHYLPLYNEVQARRHEVRPGITGWAQVNGRNAISWNQKFEYDVWYVDNLSFWLDVKILYKTVLKVIWKEGVNMSENVTMPPFRGQEV